MHTYHTVRVTQCERGSQVVAYEIVCEWILSITTAILLTFPKDPFLRPLEVVLLSETKCY